jgi:hypothetical protein
LEEVVQVLLPANLPVERAGLSRKARRRMTLLHLVEDLVKDWVGSVSSFTNHLLPIRIVPK